MLYGKNYKTVLIEIKELNKWGRYNIQWTRRYSIFNVLILSNLIYKINKIPTISPSGSLQK
jgi:hypothetical protein